MPWQLHVQQSYGVLLKKKNTGTPQMSLNVPWCKVFEQLSENFPSVFVLCMSALAGNTQPCLEKWNLDIIKGLSCTQMNGNRRAAVWTLAVCVCLKSSIKSVKYIKFDPVLF